MKVKVDGLHKSFGPNKALDGISFSFDSGHIYGFVGPNGAGKTTTMRILSTMMEPDCGDAFINGISVVQDPEKARHSVGFVPDSLPEHKDITVYEYLDFFARAYGMKGPRRQKAVNDIIEFAGLGNMLDKVLSALSKGMKQRVSVGRALLNDPSVILMDEPAAGLDPRARVELRELLTLLAEQKKAILVSSHILSELTEICHGVVIIERGRVLETGTVAEIKARLQASLQLAIRPLENLDLVRRELQQIPIIESLHEEAGELIVSVDGTERDGADILATLIQKGCRLTEFRQESVDLEDIFMSITKGDVQ
ncbi:MAG: ABC transporter ATP-binding protein [Pontiellaceae bacterium]|nr:ABC transporter ATP-binding protein [Pontiellaceae bacterium]